MKTAYVYFVLSLLICVVFSAPQYLKTNQFEESNHTDLSPQEAEGQPEVPRHTETEKLTETDKNPKPEQVASKTPEIPEITTEALKEVAIVQQPNLITKVYLAIREPLVKFLKAPKVSIVMTNVGTCIVNGAMEIISFYFPAPLIPLIASAAGLVIPFEPIVMLREKMPVTSYRRAFKTAVKGFLGTFDRYKYVEDDPYMTGKFNRRVMGNSKEVKDKSTEIGRKESLESY